MTQQFQLRVLPDQSPEKTAWSKKLLKCSRYGRKNLLKYEKRVKRASMNWRCGNSRPELVFFKENWKIKTKRSSK